MDTASEFTEAFLEKVPCAEGKVKEYEETSLLKIIRAADPEIRELFFAGTEDYRGDGTIRELTKELSRMCVLNVLFSIGGMMVSKPYDRDIDRWFEYKGLIVGEDIYRSFLTESLELPANPEREWLEELYEKMSSSNFFTMVEIFQTTQSPVPAQLMVSAMKIYDPGKECKLLNAWLGKSLQMKHDFVWWDSFCNAQTYPWFYGIDGSYFCRAIKEGVLQTINRNKNSVLEWVNKEQML